MEIVITMAGLGSRFQKAGYKEPKFMINALGKTLFEWSMDSLLDFNNENTKYTFIVRKECDAKQFIEEKMQNYNIPKENCKIIEIDYLTDGQATTCMLASPYWDKNDELLVYNIDTYVEPYEMKASDMKGDGFIPCFQAEGDHWSFVKVNENGLAIEVREKERISSNCTIGAYYFKTCGLYEKMYNEYYTEDRVLDKNEKYIAPLYNYMIENNMDLYISDIPYDKVHVLGTPEEVDYFVKTYKR